MQHPWLELSLAVPKPQELYMQWNVLVQGAWCSLAVPKWRVPNPWPVKVRIMITPRRSRSADAANLTERDSSRNHVLNREPIVATLKLVEGDELIRYRPIGEERRREMGDLILPPGIVDPAPELVRLLVLWEEK